MRTTRIPFLLIAVLAIFSPASADPFRIDSAKFKQRTRELREGAKQRLDPKTLLASSVPELKLDQTNLLESLEFLDPLLRYRLLVDWRTLKLAGIDESTKVTVHAKERPLDFMLTEVLKSAGADVKGVRFEVVDELIVISNADGIAKTKRWIANCRPASPQPQPPGLLDARIAVVSIDVCVDTRQGLFVGPEPLEDAMNEVAKEANVAIHPDWPALRKLGVRSDAEITGPIPNVSLACALTVLFFEYEGFEQVRVRESNGAVQISAD